MIATQASPSAVMLILAGQGTLALRRTLEAITASPDNVWCAVPSEEEAVAALGSARTIVLDPWPGQREALAALVAQAPIGRDDVVQTLVAGSVPDRHAMRQSIRRSEGRLMIPAQGRFRTARGFGVRAMRCAILRPGAGMTLRGSALRDLDKAGWFQGTDMTVSQIRKLVGGIRLSRPREDEAVDVQKPRSQDAGAMTLTVTVVIPAFNEQACIGETLRSVFAQSRRPDEVLVIDDGSTDQTGAIASYVGARVMLTDGTGSKGAAINRGLESVGSDVVVLVDADTRLHPEAIHHLMRDMEAGAGATHGAVLPAIERGIWARSRLLEYSLALRFHKRLQRSLGQIMVLSGCILAVRTEVLRAAGGFQPRTMVEDLDLTWTLHQRGVQVAYSPRAVAYPIEPATWVQYKGQMRRWSRGFFQSVAAHARTLRRTPALALIVVGALWDVITTPLLMLVVLGLAAFGFSPNFAMKGFLLWQVAWTTLTVVIATSVIGIRRAILGAPSYVITSMLTSYFYFEAFITEWLLRRRLHTWVKGH